MTAPENRTIREAVRLVLELEASGLPDRGSLAAPFALDFEGEDARWYGILLGGSEDAPGIALRRGAEGLRSFHADADMARDDDARRREIAAFAVPLASVELRRRDVLRRAGVVSEKAADFTYIDGRGGERFPDRAELRRLMLALRAVLAVANDETVQAEVQPGKMLVLHVRGDSRAPEVGVSIEDEPADAKRPAPRASLNVREWPLKDGEWLVVSCDDPAEAGRPAAAEILVIDRGARCLLGRFEVPPGSPEAAARALLLGIWFDEDLHEPWLARHVAVADPVVADLVRGPLADLGATCTAIDRAAAEREVLRALRDETRLLRERLQEYLEFDEAIYDDAMGEEEEEDGDEDHECDDMVCGGHDRDRPGS